jgi:hypothetical protein
MYLEKLRYVCVLVLVALLCTPVWAAEAEAEEDTEAVKAKKPGSSEEWKFTIAPYGWFTALDADTTVGDTTSSIDASISDILDVLEFAGFIHGEAQKGRWGVFGDVMYAKLGEDFNVRVGNRPILKYRASADMALKLFVAETGGFYRFGDEDLSFDLLGGARYYWLDIDLNLPGPLGIERDTDWVDAFGGGRLQGKLSDRWGFSLRADIGGGGSEISANGAALLGYRMTENSTLMFGYKALYFDYEGSKAEQEQTMHGPAIGVAFQF